MFSATRQALVHSSNRIVVSAVLHGALLALAMAFRFDSAPPPMQPSVTHIALQAPRIIHVPRPAPRMKTATPAVAPPVKVSAVRAFEPPVAKTPLRTDNRKIVLPEAENPSLAPPVAPLATTVNSPLPAAPVVVGKLSSAAAAEAAPAARAVQSSGFGSTTQVSAEPVLPRSVVAGAGFGDVSLAARSAPAARPRVPVSSSVEILSKPKPVYSDEARRLRVEGEVLLEVLFTASGEPRVVRVIQGLGHGLESAAIESATKIRYRPATTDGVPVDQSATVHIVFQLAY